MFIQEVASEVNFWRLHKAVFIARLRGEGSVGSRAEASHIGLSSLIQDEPELQC